MRKIVIPTKVLYECGKCGFKSEDEGIVRKCEAMPIKVLKGIKEGQMVLVSFKEKWESYDGLAMIVLPVFNGEVRRIKVGRKYHHAQSCLINLGFPYPDKKADRPWTYNKALYPWDVKKILSKKEIKSIISEQLAALKRLRRELKKLENKLDEPKRLDQDTDEEWERIERLKNRELPGISTGLKLLTKNQRLAPKY